MCIQTTESLDVYDNDDDDDDDDINAPEVAPEYKRIISIRAGKPRGKSLSDALALEPYVKRVSLSEPELSKVARAHPDVVVKYVMDITVMMNTRSNALNVNYKIFFLPFQFYQEKSTSSISKRHPCQLIKLQPLRSMVAWSTNGGFQYAGLQNNIDLNMMIMTNIEVQTIRVYFFFICSCYFRDMEGHFG